ncbi:MAG: transglycosylase SLT domain-containing protein, partial [Glaciimonas sp.]|nr:transglycosylase SLT domain-containing protein [Glaciimonas sp.]
MFSRSIKVGSVRVRVGENRTTLETLKQVGSSSAGFMTGIPSAIGGLISNYGSAGIVGIVALVAILFTIVGGTTLAVKPELMAQLKALPIFIDPQPVSTQATNDATNGITSEVVLVANNQPAQPVPNNNVALIQPNNAVETAHNAINSNKSATKASDSHQQQWVTNWISKRYRVAGDATNMFVSTAYKTAKETKLDPLLILAVMAIESGFNPFAESPVGAQGLMQVMSKIHHEKFANYGGIQAAMNPTANIKVGSRILSEYVTQGGSIEAGLKKYVGAAAFATNGGYGYRVLAEYK